MDVQNSLSRRRFLRLAGLASATAAIAACAPAQAPAPQIIKETVVVKETGEVQIQKETVVVEQTAVPAAPVAEVTEIEWWPGWPESAMLAIGKAFEGQNPDIKVNVVSNYPEMPAVLAAVAGGTPMDLIADVPYMELIARGTCQPIDDFIATNTVVSLTDGDIRKELWEVFAWQGKHYGVPSIDTAGREGMGFNLSLIEKSGLDPNNLPTTWEDVFAWHQKITKLDSAGNIEILGMAPMAERTDACSYGDPWMWPHMWGFAYIKDEVYDIDRPETVEFLNVIKQFSDSVGVEKIESLSSALQGIARGAFGVGRVAMRITYPSGPKSVWQTNPTQKYTFTYVPVPASRKGKKIQTAGGHAALLMKDAKHHEQSFRLSAFLAGKEACDILFDEIGWLGPRKSWQQALDMSRYPEDVQKSMKFFTDSLESADEVWWNTDPIEGITGNEWLKQYQAVMYGQTTPDEAAKAMQDTLTAELAKALEERG